MSNYETLSKSALVTSSHWAGFTWPQRDHHWQEGGMWEYFQSGSSWKSSPRDTRWYRYIRAAGRQCHILDKGSEIPSSASGPWGLVIWNTLPCYYHTFCNLVTVTVMKRWEAAKANLCNPLHRHHSFSQFGVMCLKIYGHRYFLATYQ